MDRSVSETLIFGINANGKGKKRNLRKVFLFMFINSGASALRPLNVCGKAYKCEIANVR